MILDYKQQKLTPVTLSSKGFIVRTLGASQHLLEAKEGLVGENPTKVKPRSMVWLGHCCWDCHQTPLAVTAAGFPMPALL